jgi:hypothetical protein
MASKNELPEVHVNPLGDMMLDFLIDRDKEDADIDFKQTLGIGKEYLFAKIAEASSRHDFGVV